MNNSTYIDEAGRERAFSAEGNSILRSLNDVKERVEVSLAGADDNFDSLQKQWTAMSESVSDTFGKVDENFDVVEEEVNAVFKKIAEDINAIRADCKILHEVINDIDNEKSSLEERMDKIACQVGLIDSKISMILHSYPG